MLNHIWAAMIAIGIIYGRLQGTWRRVANGALDAAGEAVQLCITMIGVMGLWVGLMEIASKSGLIASMTRGIQPFITFLFPRIPKEHPRQAVHIHKYHRQYPRSRLGLHSRRPESHGRTGPSGGRAPKSRLPLQKRGTRRQQ